eukprot:TRINITY_DN145_c0_g3_i1.p2 TRINITY_DN145_c0_g3~~TRINITY_DN145_c0_g3_i1.p2  ORF type:complete len:341 (+),score=93.70 TRINITY_DN145_c0_g3_i1:54-1025(+)
MVGLKTLRKKEVENIVSYCMKKYPTVKAFLSPFEHLLEKFYELRDYNGDWIAGLNQVHARYTKATEDFRKHTSTTNAYGPLFLGVLHSLGLLSDDQKAFAKSKRAWEKARKDLMSLMKDPRNKKFHDLAKALQEGVKEARKKMGEDDFLTLLQAFGCNYFAAREAGRTHEAAMTVVNNLCGFFKSKEYATIASELKAADEEKLKSMAESLVLPKFNDKLFVLDWPHYVLGAIGIVKGITGLVCYCCMACPVFGVSMMAFGGLFLLCTVFVPTTDARFKDAHAFGDDCKNVIDEYERIYGPMNEALQHMLNFMKQSPPPPATGG